MLRKVYLDRIKRFASKCEESHIVYNNYNALHCIIAPYESLKIQLK